MANTFLAPPPRVVAALVSVSDDNIQITILILRRGALSTQYSDIFLCSPDVDFYLSSENNGLATDSFKPRYFSSENNEWDTKDTRETFRICSFKYDQGIVLAFFQQW